MKKTNIWLFLMLLISIGYGQDAQFSQYYASFTYLNPALPSVIDNVKLGTQYRSQWKNANTLFTSTLGYGAINFEKQKSALSLQYHGNNQGFGTYRHQNMGLGYSFGAKIGQNSKICLGLQGVLSNESLDFAKLTFGDELTDAGATNPTQETYSGMGRNNFFDFNSGMLIYGKKAFIGLAVSHLAEPQFGFGQEKSTLYRKYLTHAGWKIASNDDMTKNWILTTNLKHQGKFDQMDFGTYLDLKYITFGAWYRGLPLLKNFNGVVNNESFIAMAGMKIKKIVFAYSYDYVISGLASNAHEISIYYEFRVDKKITEPKLGLPIPMF
jgi:type IX secretion system PorP/SprF family membrane protein